MPTRVASLGNPQWEPKPKVGGENSSKEFVIHQSHHGNPGGKPKQLTSFG